MPQFRAVLTAAALIASLASSAFAAGGAWIGTANEPQIYQTNLWNGPSTIESLITSDTAIITTISLAWGYTYTYNALDPTYTISAAVCWNENSSICKIATGSVTGGSLSNSSDLAGYAANKDFSVYTNAVSSTTKSFAARPNASRTFSLTVNYSE